MADSGGEPAKAQVQPRRFSVALTQKHLRKDQAAARKLKTKLVAADSGKERLVSSSYS